MKNSLKMLLWICNIILYLVLMGTWISIPDEMTLNIALTLFNLSLSSIMIIWDRKRFRDYYNSDQFKGIADTIISASLIFIIFGLINFWVFKHPISFDLTKNQNNSLTDQTIKVLKELKGPVTFKVFSNTAHMAPIKALLEMYRFNKSDISIETYDVELRPDLVKKYDITSAPTLVAIYKDRVVKEIPKSELNITNTLIKVSRTKDPVILFSTGHGEASLLDKSEEGISRFGMLLKAHLFELNTKNLASLEKIDPSISTVVIWGAQSDFHPHEIKLLEEYLDQGGELIVAMDPHFSKDPVPSIRALLKKRGILLNNDLVVDSLNHYSGSKGTIPLIKKFDPKGHLITKSFKGPVFFPLASSVELDEEKIKELKGRGSVLIKTTQFPASWAEKSNKEILSSNIKFNQEEDKRGPIPLMGTVETNKNRILAIGNARFILNGYSSFGQNYLLALNSFNWTTYQDELISFNLPTIKDEPIFISSPQLGVIFYFSVIALPLLFFGLSIYFYRRRLVL